MTEYGTRTVQTEKNARLAAEDELHAYVDGFLPAADRARVEIYLSAHPEERKRVDSFIQQNILLHRLFDWHLGEPGDRAFEGIVEKFARSERRFTRWGTLLGAAAVTVAVVGASGFGWLSYSWFGHRDIARTEFIEQAAEAHTLAGELVPSGLLFSNTGSDDEDIFKWIGSHYKTMPRRAPDFSGLGFGLAGARVLPTGSGPAIDLLYTNPAFQQRVTLFMGRAGSGSNTALLVKESEAITMIYREDHGVAYGFIGNVKAPTLIDMERIVSAMLDKTTHTLSPAEADRARVEPAQAGLARDDGVASGKSVVESRFPEGTSSQATRGPSVRSSPQRDPSQLSAQKPSPVDGFLADGSSVTE